MRTSLLFLAFMTGCVTCELNTAPGVRVEVVGAGDCFGVTVDAYQGLASDPLSRVSGCTFEGLGEKSGVWTLVAHDGDRSTGKEVLVPEGECHPETQDVTLKFF